MSKHVRTGLLAAAALASIAVAGVRIAGAARHVAGNVSQELRIGTTRALVVAALAQLRAPVGYRPSRRRIHEPTSACFSRARSLPLDNGTTASLLASLGVKPVSVYGTGRAGCARVRHFRMPSLTFEGAATRPL